MLMLDARGRCFRQPLKHRQATPLDTTMIRDHMVRDAEQPRQRTPMLAATGRTPAVGPYEYLGRDVLDVNYANTSRDIAQDTRTVTVVQLSKRGRRLDRPPNQLQIAEC